MNSRIETGFAAVCAATNLEVREATSSKPLPSDLQVVIIECPEVEHMAGPLHRATVRVILRTPAFDMSESRHRDAAGAVAMAFIDPVAVATNFNAAAGNLSLCGFHVRSQSEEVADNAWHSTIELLAGIRVG